VSNSTTSISFEALAHGAACRSPSSWDPLRALIEDRRTQLDVERSFEIIGEALLRLARPQLPGLLAAMRMVR
jgi:hypothetical protein